MNKEIYLENLETLLIKNNVENTYTILREVASNIEVILKYDNNFDNVIKQLGTPEILLNKYLNNNKEESFKEPIFKQKTNPNNQNSNQYRDSYYETHFKHEASHTEDSQFRKPNITTSTLIILIIIGIIFLVLSLIFGLLSFSLHGPSVFFSHGFSIIKSIIIVILIILVIQVIKNKK
ncbi:MAG: hypothetical protein LBT75_03700 [Bacilli bacterium]|nr:hypothetical protein [Bacilli bacterium]